MNELSLLQAMWRPKAKRNINLIVPAVTYKNGCGSLNNESWAFIVTYAFRDALDIKYEERKRDKKSYMIWTQGPNISFKEGDLIHSRDGKLSLQVLLAKEMEWSKATTKMNHGMVKYTQYGAKGNSQPGLYTKLCTQMQFLKFLIYGAYESE